jgi:hypothetical protein
MVISRRSKKTGQVEFKYAADFTAYEKYRRPTYGGGKVYRCTPCHVKFGKRPDLILVFTERKSQ